MMALRHGAGKSRNTANNTSPTTRAVVRNGVMVSVRSFIGEARPRGRFELFVAWRLGLPPAILRGRLQRGRWPDSPTFRTGPGCPGRGQVWNLLWAGLALIYVPGVA